MSVSEREQRSCSSRAANGDHERRQAKPTNSMQGKRMASQLFADLYGCDEKMLNSEEKICTVARLTVSEIGAEIVEECIHTFEPIGITYFAVITTSHFSIHTWPEYGYAAVDVFSCGEAVTDRITGLLQEAFGATDIRVRRCERFIGRRPKTDQDIKESMHNVSIQKG